MLQKLKKSRSLDTHSRADQSSTKKYCQEGRQGQILPVCLLGYREIYCFFVIVASVNRKKHIFKTTSGVFEHRALFRSFRIVELVDSVSSDEAVFLILSIPSLGIFQIVHKMALVWLLEAEN